MHDQKVEGTAMKTGTLAVLLVTVAAVGAVAGSAMADENNWPHSGTLVDGSTFQLNPRIEEKLKAHEPINYLFSYASSSTDLYSAQIEAGYKHTLDAANAIYPLNARSIAPATAYDANLQISQIEAQFNSNQIDCLSIAVNGADAFTEITRRVMADGIPVFTNGAPTNGNELGQFTQVPEKEGVQAADYVLNWMAESGKSLKTFAVSGGNPSATWAQGRMISFENRIKEKIPDAVFVTDHTNALNTTFAAAQQYSAFSAFFLAHPEVEFMLNVDQGAGQADKAIVDQGMVGKVYTLGWNNTDDQLDGIQEGVQIALLDQKWSDQGGYGALACATFLAKGEILPNTQQLIVVGPDNVEEARAEIRELLGNSRPGPGRRLPGGGVPPRQKRRIRDG
jgi:ABC-type sugar transport system substrate-binding protein